jgi:hypothetical protein
MVQIGMLTSEDSLIGSIEFAERLGLSAAVALSG